MARAGRLQIPFTTGILVGIGESWQDRVESLQAIADLHRVFGHIQEVIIQPLDPKPGTALANAPRPSDERSLPDGEDGPRDSARLMWPSRFRPIWWTPCRWSKRAQMIWVESAL